MYGVPEDLDLSVFRGAALIQVALGEFQVQFHFQPDGYIGVEGHWELRDASGALVDQAVPNAEREAYRVHTLLGHTVTATQVDPPRSFTLTFHDGKTLTVFDDSEQYESFCIQPGNIFV